MCSERPQLSARPIVHCPVLSRKGERPSGRASLRPDRAERGLIFGRLYSRPGNDLTDSIPRIRGGSPACAHASAASEWGGGLLRRTDGIASFSECVLGGGSSNDGARKISRTVGAGLPLARQGGIKPAGKVTRTRKNIGAQWARRRLSLFALQLFPVPAEKFPVPLLREFGRNELNLLLDCTQKLPGEPRTRNIPC